MKSRIIILALFVVLGNTAFGQIALAMNTIKAENNDITVGNSTEASVKTFDYSVIITEEDIQNRIKLESANHSLGEEIGSLKELIRKTYTSTTPIGPGNPGVRIMVKKPSLYNSVLAIDKYYKKRVKKEKSNTEILVKEYAEALKKAYMVFYEDTVDLENVLKNAKTKEDRVKIFKNINIARM